MLSPTCMSGVPRRGPAGWRSARSRDVAVGALRVAQPAHGQLEVGQRDGTAQDVGDVAHELEPPDGSAYAASAVGEVAQAPGREPHQCGGRRRGPGRRPGSSTPIASRPWSIVAATSPAISGQPGAVDPDPAGEPAPLGGIGDERGRPGARLRALPGVVHPLLGNAQPGLDPAGLAGGHQGADVAVRQHGTTGEDLVGERLHPAAQLGFAALLGHGRDDSSTRPAARSTSPAARACSMAAVVSPSCSCQALARRCSSDASPGRSSRRRACSMSAKRWW